MKPLTCTMYNVYGQLEDLSLRFWLSSLTLRDSLTWLFCMSAIEWHSNRSCTKSSRGIPMQARWRWLFLSFVFYLEVGLILFHYTKNNTTLSLNLFVVVVVPRYVIPSTEKKCYRWWKSNHSESYRTAKVSLLLTALSFAYMLEATVAQTFEAKLLKNYLCKALLLPLTNVAYNLWQKLSQVKWCVNDIFWSQIHFRCKIIMDKISICSFYC